MDSQPTPPGWDNDPLTRYLDDARGNQFATFANKRSEVIDLITIDGMFRKLLDGALNPRPFVPMGFLLRAHSAYLSAVGAVMAGQAYESQALLRVCLEQGAYAHYIGDDKARYELWLNRHDSPATMQAVREEFTYGKVSRHLTDADAKLGSVYKTLYERTIDRGAHPNVMGTSLSSKFLDLEDGGKQILAIYLQGEGLLLDGGLKAAAQVGLWVLRIAQSIYPARVQAVGIQYQLADMLERF
ncbi:hypothetical protein [Rhodovulum euryhalinum]|uniref:Uncharacterized protein n=1 Tax=Rhodovulum euryhalinum TaxID=35805 RepID=A0A4R2KB02_9RHOB|nr:hypothetical protein [Rhodovulum euryhalinum]TCO69217.1 hypothetical protein EV655_11750 [Rhodovulum euryhalinum]